MLGATPSIWEKGHVEKVVFNCLLEHGIDGFTYWWCTGVWKGREENTLCILVYTEETLYTFERICEDVARVLLQEAILLEYEGTAMFIEGGTK